MCIESTACETSCSRTGDNDARMQRTTPSSSGTIGVFDSGIGGLSILRDLRARLPWESFVYYADSAHNPYGEKGDAYVAQRSLSIAQDLLETHHIRALVVACNTATAAAIELLRQQWPALAIVGVEPALKPAAAISRTRRIAVLATRGTLASTKFAALLASQRDQAEYVCMPCDGLAEQIEQSLETSVTPDLVALCSYYMRACGHFSSKNGGIDTLVLGCTHYPLIRPVFESLVGADVNIIDNGPAVAERLASLLGATTATSTSTSLSQVKLLSSADQATLERIHARIMPSASNLSGAATAPSRTRATP